MNIRAHRFHTLGPRSPKLGHDVKWLICCPAWGERCIDHFVYTTALAIERAIDYAGITPRWLVHTDQPERIRATGIKPIDIRPLVTQRSSYYYTLSDCHRAGVSAAERGEAVAIINADMVPSVEFFTACEKRFSEGKRIIMSAAPRTLSDKPPSIGIKSRQLLEWVWEHRHPAIEDGIWGSGQTVSLATLQFVHGENVVMRAFHMQPAAFMKDNESPYFDGVTCDDGLIDLFPKKQIHVVTDADELAFAEMSPGSRKFHRFDRLYTPQDVVAWARHAKGNRPRATKMHRWLFSHRICLRGTTDDPELGDGAVCDSILRMLDARAL